MTEVESSGELTVWLSSPSSFREEEPESAQGLHIFINAFTQGLHVLYSFYARWCRILKKNLHLYVGTHTHVSQTAERKEGILLPP